jgi:hypothetical protein
MAAPAPHGNIRSVDEYGFLKTEAQRQPRRAFSIAAMSIFVIVIVASKARLASAPPSTSASVSTA